MPLLKVILTYLTLTVISTSFAVAEPAPEISIDQSTHDFGEILQGDVVTHEFRFQNTGDAPLIVERVKSSCGCTVALASDAKIAPGKSSTLDAKFNSARFRGRVGKTIYIYTNDPKNSVMEMRLQGNVRPVLDIKPPVANLGVINVGSSASVTLDVTNSSKSAVTISRIRSSNLSAVSGTLEKNSLEPGETTRLTVTSGLQEPLARLNGYLLLLTNIDSLGEIRIPVKGGVSRQPENR